MINLIRSTMLFNTLRRTQQKNFQPSILFKGIILTGFAGLTYTKMMSFQQKNLCQAGIDYKNNYGGRLTTLNHIGVVKHLMSQLRDK